MPTAPRIPVPARARASEPSSLIPVVALCLPPVLLACRGMPELFWYGDDPFPVVGGFALAALGSLWAALWLLPRGRACDLQPLTLLLTIVLTGLCSYALGRASDELEARRAFAAAGVAGVMLAVGGALRPSARANHARALVLLSLCFGLPALLGYLVGDENSLAGTLGNTGTLSQAALPGALIGVWLAARRPGIWRWIGGLAALTCVLQALLAPVLAGALIFAAVLLLLAFVPRDAGASPGLRRVLVASAGLVLVALLATRMLPANSGADAVPAPTVADPGPSPAIGADSRRPADAAAAGQPASSAPVSSSTGGIEVRWRIWRSLGALYADHWLLGTGPGQFLAVYPPYRDPREIELSAPLRAEDGGNEVEHAHNDWLEGPAEWGLIGGAAWLLLLLFGARAAWNALRTGDGTRVMLGAALAGLLLNACVHAPFSANPASACQGFALLGMLLHGTREREPARWAGLVVRFIPLALLLLALPSALRLVAHEHALAQRQRILKRFAQESAELLPGSNTHESIGYARAAERLQELVAATRASQRSLLEQALAAVPGSAPARSYWARHLEGDPATRTLALTEWQRVLAARPHSIEALMQAGVLQAEQGHSDEARELWRHVLDLDPGHTGALANLALLAARSGDGDALRELLERWRGTGRSEADWLEQHAAHELLGGDLRAGLLLLAASDPALSPPTPEVLDFAAGKRPKREGDLYAEALRCGAEWQWGRQHVEAGSPELALPKYRQALRATRHLSLAGALPVRLELAAALCLAGRKAEARAELKEAGDPEETLKTAPAWALAALQKAGLVAP